MFLLYKLGHPVPRLLRVSFESLISQTGQVVVRKYKKPYVFKKCHSCTQAIGAKTRGIECLKSINWAMGHLASNAAALLPSPRVPSSREGTRGEGNKAAALEAIGHPAPQLLWRSICALTGRATSKAP